MPAWKIPGYAGCLTMLCLATMPASGQTAYSPFNNQRSVHNACWQALRIPPSRDYPTNPQHQRDLEACKAAGGPDAYLRGRRNAQAGGTARPAAPSAGLSCADLAGRWSGPWTFVGPRSGTPRSTLTVVAGPDCRYMFSGRYWSGTINTPGRFTISGTSISYRNDAGSYGPVTLRRAGNATSLHFVQTQGNYVATVTRRGR